MEKMTWVITFQVRRIFSEYQLTENLELQNSWSSDELKKQFVKLVQVNVLNAMDSEEEVNDCDSYLCLGITAM